MTSPEQFEAREILLYKKTRQERVENLVRDTARKHELSGFIYPISPTIGNIRPFRITPRVLYSLPEDSGSCEDSLCKLFNKVIYNNDKTAIYINFDAIEDLRSGIDLFQGRLEDEPEFRKRFGGMEVALKALPNINQVFRPTTSSELESLISKALGEYLLEVLLKKHPRSWLLIGNESSETDFAKRMVRNGVASYFEKMFLLYPETISESVWERDSGSPDLARKNSSLRSWYIEKAGHGLTYPLLNSFKDKAIEYLVTHKLDISPDYHLSEVLRYKNRALNQLQKN